MKVLYVALGAIGLFPTMGIAGPSNTPLPTFAGGTPAVAVYYAVGVIKNNNLESDFICTNMDVANVHIGVEVFDETGALRNAIAAGNGAILNLAAGETRTIGTSGTALLHEDATITLNAAGNGVSQLRNGSARIVASSKNVQCTAMVLDELHQVRDPLQSPEPPPTSVHIPLVRVP